MRLELVGALQILIIAFISYVISITFAGWFESLIAKCVGDDSPENAGFLTLNPLEHFNVFGFAAVLWGEFYRTLLPFQLIPGWGRQIPLVPDVLYGRYLRLRVFVEYLARSCAHLILLMVVAIVVMVMCGASLVNILDMNPVFLSFTSPTLQTLLQLTAFVYKQNFVLFIIHFVIGLFKSFVYFYMPRLQEPTILMFLLSILILTGGLMLFGPMLFVFVYAIMSGIQTTLVMLGR
jgi:hypothetical protein